MFKGCVVICWAYVDFVGLGGVGRGGGSTPGGAFLIRFDFHFITATRRDRNFSSTLLDA